MILLTCTLAQAQPQALVPLPTPQFSIDRNSPSASPALPASAILKKPGPMVAFSGYGMGLPSPQDELDDFCYGRWQALQSQPAFLLLFGVDRSSAGGALPDTALYATGRIFNVHDQAARHQAAADLFLTLDAFNLDGYVGPKNAKARANNNTLAVNQGDSGGVDKDLSPDKSPVQQIPPAQAIDDGDGAAYPPSGSKSRSPTVFFTISRDSPSLPSMPGIPGQQSGADVFRDSNPAVPGNESLYVAASVLGLQPTASGDDIDALVVFDDGDEIFEPGVDAILFSLKRNSISLNQGPRSPGDLFISRGNYTFSLFAAAENLGLLFNDNVTCLEIVPTNNPTATVFDHAIFLVWPGDYDKDGHLTSMDCQAFPSCYSGSGAPYDTNGSAVHVVQVGPGPVFNPGSITVETGDTVRWTWVDGPHNVVSGFGGLSDGIFNSGPPTGPPPPLVFEVVFDEALLNVHPVSGSIYRYYSDPDYMAGMIGTVTVQPHPCATFDLDFDGDVDCADWREFKPVYAEATGGGACASLSVSGFVAALLGAPVPPVYLCVADMNGDGRVDGLDIQPYVKAVLYP